MIFQKQRASIFTVESYDNNANGYTNAKDTVGSLCPSYAERLLGAPLEHGYVMFGRVRNSEYKYEPAMAGYGLPLVRSVSMEVSCGHACG